MGRREKKDRGDLCVRARSPAQSSRPPPRSPDHHRSDITRFIDFYKTGILCVLTYDKSLDTAKQKL